MSSFAKSLQLGVQIDQKQPITKQHIQKFHNEQLLNGNNNTENTATIVEILGGIDSVLNIYLTQSNHIPITNDQLLRLHQVLQTPAPYQQKNQIALANKIPNNHQTDKEVKEQQTEFSYTFDINDTVLHSICTPTIADKIKSFIDNKIVLLFLVATGIISIVLFLILGATVLENVYELTTVALFWIPWLILKHLSLNKPAFILCIKTFDYWIKVCYGFIGGVARLFYNSLRTQHGFSLTNMRECLWIVSSVLMISYIASFDATNTSKKKKLIFSACMCCFASLFAITFQFFAPEKDDYKILIHLTKSVISVQSILAHSYRILAIFFWKQIINIGCENGKAALIRRSPKIIWTDYNNEKKKNMIKRSKETTMHTKSTKIHLEENNKEINICNVSSKYQKSESESSLSTTKDQTKEIEIVLEA